MDVYTYRYSCQRWYSVLSGTRNLYLEQDVVPEVAAKNDAKRITGSTDCDIQLIQRFKMVITDVETFPAMACQPLFRYNKGEK